jgi:sulfide:quinone oxidoreductase
MRVLIAGGGVAGLEALLGLRKLAEERAQIELLAPQRDFVYRPLAVAEPFGVGRAHRFDLASIVEERGGRFRADALRSVDPACGLARTRAGEEIGFDALIVATGAAVREALPGAFTFWGTPGTSGFRRLLTELEDRRTGDLVFAVNGGAGWPLPLYELAILSRAHLDAHGGGRINVTLVTHEAAPLELFGVRASEAVAALLAERGIGLCTSSYPAAIEDGALALVPAGHLTANWVVTLPRLEGPALPGLPHDDNGFIPTDDHGRVPEVEGVYAAGDATSFPIKQGGIAAQQADAAAESLAAEAGAPVDPRPFRPVLRGLLLTGREPAFLRAELTGGHGETSVAAPHPLWWPPGKIAGHHLAPYLAALARTKLEPPPIDAEALPVDIELTEGAGALH